MSWICLYCHCCFSNCGAIFSGNNTMLTEYSFILYWMPSSLNDCVTGEIMLLLKFEDVSVNSVDWNRRYSDSRLIWFLIQAKCFSCLSWLLLKCLRYDNVLYAWWISKHPSWWAIITWISSDKIMHGCDEWLFRQKPFTNQQIPTGEPQPLTIHQNWSSFNIMTCSPSSSINDHQLW